MKRIFIMLCAGILAAAVFISCDAGSAGLFATLEKEVPLDEGTAAFNANTAAFVTKLGTYYYAGVGSTLLRRQVAGETWEKITDTGAPSGSSITAGVTDGTNLYISYAPEIGSIRYTTDGTTWLPYVITGLPTDEPIQNLLYANGNLLAVTQRSTDDDSDDYTQYYSIYYYSGSWTESPIDGSTTESGLPSSIAWDGTNYWISAGNTIFTGTDPSLLAVDATNVSAAGFSSEDPVFCVWYDDDLTSNDTVLAAATGKVWKLETSGYTASDTFDDSDCDLSSVIVVPANSGTTTTGYATVVGAKAWGSDEYTGYYEYDAFLNGSFGTGVTPDTDYTMVSTYSNFVTTLEDLSIDGFYYDSVEQVLFARTIQGGLWSNSYSGSAWSGWDRE